MIYFYITIRTIVIVILMHFCNAMFDWISSRICDSSISHFVEACNTPNLKEIVELHLNGDNHVQNFLFWKYIVGYTVENHVLRLARASL